MKPSTSTMRAALKAFQLVRISAIAECAIRGGSIPLQIALARGRTKELIAENRSAEKREEKKASLPHYQALTCSQSSPTTSALSA
jgi:hypothetical protein